MDVNRILVAAVLLTALTACAGKDSAKVVLSPPPRPPPPTPPPTPSCTCSQPLTAGNTLFAWASAGKAVTLGQECSTCTGPTLGAWFRINRSSTTRLFLVDVCAATKGQLSMLMDVYSAASSKTNDACNATQLARVASYRVPFGNSVSPCLIRFLALPYTMYLIRGWYDPARPLPVSLTCGPALATITRLQTSPQQATCKRPIMVNMRKWRPSPSSLVPPMFSFGNGTSTCGKPEGQSSWAGLPGERDVSYRFYGATTNMTLTLVVNKEPGHNEGNSPYETPVLRAFMWREGLCDVDTAGLDEVSVGDDVSQYLSESYNGVSSVLQLDVGPGMVVAVVVTNIGGYDELCGRGALDVWAELGPHTFIPTGQPSD